VALFGSDSAAHLIEGTLDGRDQAFLDGEHVTDGYSLTEVAYPLSNALLSLDLVMSALWRGSSSWFGGVLGFRILAYDPVCDMDVRLGM
jgi:hypothetical protein